MSDAIVKERGPKRGLSPIILNYSPQLFSQLFSRVQQRPDRTSVFAQYTVFVDDREGVQAKLKEAGIPTAVHYPVPLNQQPAYRRLCCPDCTPNAVRVVQRVMSLPMHPFLEDVNQDRVVRCLVKQAMQTR